MATIIHAIDVACDAAAAWDAVRDIGEIHRRLAPGMVTDCVILVETAPIVRLVTFADGMQLRETIVSSDDATRRLVWKIDDAMVEHHNGSLQVVVLGTGTCRVTWIADLLPDALAVPFGQLMQSGLATMAATLEQAEPV